MFPAEVVLFLDFGRHDELRSYEGLLSCPFDLQADSISALSDAGNEEASESPLITSSHQLSPLLGDESRA